MSPFLRTAEDSSVVDLFARPVPDHLPGDRKMIGEKTGFSR
jgi:hypothetical protein